MEQMQDFHHAQRGHLEFPVSSVRPESSVRADLARKLDVFDGLVLSSQDDGFLRLAQLVAEAGGGFDSRLDPDEDLGGLRS